MYVYRTYQRFNLILLRGRKINIDKVTREWEFTFTMTTLTIRKYWVSWELLFQLHSLLPSPAMLHWVCAAFQVNLIAPCFGIPGTLHFLPQGFSEDRVGSQLRSLQELLDPHEWVTWKSEGINTPQATLYPRRIRANRYMLPLFVLNGYLWDTFHMAPWKVLVALSAESPIIVASIITILILVFTPF